MYDKNGKKVGVLAHEIKTHVTNDDEGEVLSTLPKDLDHIKINDKFSNADMEYDLHPRERSNKDNPLAHSINISEHVKKLP